MYRVPFIPHPHGRQSLYSSCSEYYFNTLYQSFSYTVCRYCPHQKCKLYICQQEKKSQKGISIGLVCGEGREVMVWVYRLILSTYSPHEPQAFLFFPAPADIYLISLICPLLNTPVPLTHCSIGSAFTSPSTQAVPIAPG